jgi:hypothetical protein
MPYTPEELKESVRVLRERRQHIAELRNYKPQRGKAARTEQADIPLEDMFAGLIKPEDGGEANGVDRRDGRAEG